MGRKYRYIELTASEQSFLSLAYKNGKTHDYRKRCHCILLSAQNWKITELSDFFGVGRLTITNWLNRYEKEGLSGLKTRIGRGRKRKLDLENPNHIDLVKKGLKKENRSLKQLKQELEEELGTTLGLTTLRDFLKDLVTDTEDSDSASNRNKIQGRWLKK